MAVGGYIKLYRSLLEWEWWGDSSTTVLFIYLLIKANITEGRFKGTVIPRGSLVCSLPTLSAGTGLSVRSVRTALDHLQATGEVTVSKTPKFSVVAVKNYEKYQSGDTLADSQSTRELTVNRQSIDSQSTKSKEYKKNKNNKNIYNREQKKSPAVTGNEGASYDVEKATADATMNRPILKKRNPETGQYQDCYFDEAQGKTIFI